MAECSTRDRVCVSVCLLMLTSAVWHAGDHGGLGLWSIGILVMLMMPCTKWMGLT